MTKIPLPYPVVTKADGSLDPVAVQANLDALSVGESGKTAVVSHGYWADATEESTTSASYVSLGDSVQVVLPNKGLIFAAYVATWKESVGSAARAALFFNDEQQHAPYFTEAAPFPTEAIIFVADTWKPLAAAPVGLFSGAGSLDADEYTGDVTTGQSVGVADENAAAAPYFMFGPFVGWADAGTYTVGPRFKTSSGTVTVKDRQLWVWTQSMPNQAT